VATLPPAGLIKAAATSTPGFVDLREGRNDAGYPRDRDGAPGLPPEPAIHTTLAREHGC
jgi:hypothetical protein